MDSEKNIHINYKATFNWFSVICRHAHVEKAGKSGRFFDIFLHETSSICFYEMQKITFRHLKKCKNTTILWWVRSRDLDGYQIPVTTGVLELETSYKQCIYLIQLAILFRLTSSSVLFSSFHFNFYHLKRRKYLT